MSDNIRIIQADINDARQLQKMQARSIYLSPARKRL